MITPELLTGSGLCSPSLADQWAAPLEATAERFQIDSDLRVAGFLSQIAHESGGFRFVVENLNYSIPSLLAVFGRYFNGPQATEYARQPEKIANRVYANRLGNGDEASGTGWMYRGRGLVQLTGCDNYAAFQAACASDIDGNVVTNPELLESPDLAALSAGWFWSTHHLNEIADTGDVSAMTRRVNGGLNGLDDRTAKYNAIRAYQLAQK